MKISEEKVAAMVEALAEYECRPRLPDGSRDFSDGALTLPALKPLLEAYHRRRARKARRYEVTIPDWMRAGETPAPWHTVGGPFETREEAVAWAKEHLEAEDGALSVICWYTTGEDSDSE